MTRDKFEGLDRYPNPDMPKDLAHLLMDKADKQVLSYISFGLVVKCKQKLRAADARLINANWAFPPRMHQRLKLLVREAVDEEKEEEK